MPVRTLSIDFETRGNADIIEITDQIASAILQSELTDGIVTIFSPSATSAITTIEYESGCLSDLRRLFDEIIPPDIAYKHNERWGDGNGHAHVRAALVGPSLTIPMIEKRLVLGTWQQVIFIDFDNRPRRRELILQIVGD
ncbi:MAG: secondary thiamine-phosphate synthase enzyme YjbQ [Anaerolineales bacterium]|jgi:secondary thiamine-phosphate synthase enzyme